eukprot:3750936-Pleurochrysis_carterae.AAC.1
MPSVAEIAALLATPEAPTDLVACEFSGAVRDALLASGRRALSCDVRSCESQVGHHFRGDVREIAHLRRWE